MIDRSITYLSVDIEADGPIPGDFSMLAIGCVAFDERGKELGTFSRNLERLPGANEDADTMAWWAKNADAWKKIHENVAPAKTAISELKTWLGSLPGKVTFVGYPASYDFMFAYWYLRHFFPSEPVRFGFQALDIKTLAMSHLQIDFYKVSKKTMPRSWFAALPKHTHDPLDDAREQAALFLIIRDADRLSRIRFDSKETV